MAGTRAGSGSGVSGPSPFVFEAGGETKRFAPATERNREAIADVLDRMLPAKGTVLEIASGTGEHIVYFARRFLKLTWQPSDPDPTALASIAAWADEAGCSNLKQPLQLDAASDWSVKEADAVVCINMVHISPWVATLGLLRNAARILPPGAPLYLYGPFRQASIPTAPSNEAFDESLKSRDPQWGLRAVEAIEANAHAAGLTSADIIQMPANNLSLIFRRADTDA